MQLLKNHAYIHGFEDYKVVNLGDGCFHNTWDFHCPYNFDTNTQTYLIVRDLPVTVYVEKNPVYDWIKTVCFEPAVCENHKELLDTAKKVFTHTNCKLSRSLMAEKYKKSLNPWLSDAIVVPQLNTAEFYLNKCALFIHEDDKMIIKVELGDKTEEKAKDFVLGAIFREYATCNPDHSYGDRSQYNVDHIMDSELIFVGDVLSVPNSFSYVTEILTGAIPANKIVFEDSVQESLSNETNQLDFDSLCSIKDMLESSDENTVAAGLKSLSMMDWMHFPESIRFILNNVSNKWNWIYNKACNSTSVKYMIKTIAGDRARKRSWWPGDFSEDIYERDFELFKQLKCHYHHIQPLEVMTNIRAMNFITVSPEGLLSPNLKVID